MFYYTKMVLKNYLEFNGKVMLFGSVTVREWSLMSPFTAHSSGCSHLKHSRVVTDHSVTKPQITLFNNI